MANNISCILPSDDVICPGYLDISTRPKRREAAYFLSVEIAKVYRAEEEYQEKIPFNLQNSMRYTQSELSLEFLLKAYEALTDAF